MIVAAFSAADRQRMSLACSERGSRTAGVVGSAAEQGLERRRSYQPPGGGIASHTTPGLPARVQASCSSRWRNRAACRGPRTAATLPRPLRRPWCMHLVCPGATRVPHDPPALFLAPHAAQDPIPPPQGGRPISLPLSGLRQADAGRSSGGGALLPRGLGGFGNSIPTSSRMCPMGPKTWPSCTTFGVISTRPSITSSSFATRWAGHAVRAASSAPDGSFASRASRRATSSRATSSWRSCLNIAAP